MKSFYQAVKKAGGIAVFLCLLSWLLVLMFVIAFSGCEIEQEKEHEKEQNKKGEESEKEIILEDIEFNNAEKLWGMSMEKEHFAGTTMIEPVPGGFLILADNKVFLVNPETGEKKWELEDFSPLVSDIVIDPPVLIENEKIVLSLRDMNYRGDRMEGNNVPSLIKIDIEDGEILWKQPLARNTPPLNVSELLLKNENIIARGNFYGGEDYESREPVYGAHAAGLAVHDFGSGELKDAFSAYFGSILVKDELAYFSSSEQDSYEIGLRDIMSGEIKNKTRVDKEPGKDMEEVVAFKGDCDVIWRREGRILPGLNTEGGLCSLFPNFVLFDDFKRQGMEVEEARILMHKSEGPDSKQKIMLVNAQDGQVISEYELENLDGGFMIEEKALLAGGNKLIALETSDGGVLWEKDLEKEQSLYVEKSGEILKKTGCFPVFTEKNKLYLLDIFTGREVNSFTGVEDVIISQKKPEIFLIGEDMIKSIIPEAIKEDQVDIDTAWRNEVKKLDGEERLYFLEDEKTVVFSTKEAASVIDRESGKESFSCRFQTEYVPVMLKNERMILDGRESLIYIGKKN